MLVRGSGEVLADAGAVSARDQDVPRFFVNVYGWSVAVVPEETESGGG